MQFAHVSHAQTFLAYGSRAQLSFSCAVSKNNHPDAHVVFRTLLDPTPVSSTLSTPTSSASLLYASDRTSPVFCWSAVFDVFSESVTDARNSTSSPHISPGFFIQQRMKSTGLPSPPVSSTGFGTHPDTILARRSFLCLGVPSSCLCGTQISMSAREAPAGTW